MTLNLSFCLLGVLSWWKRIVSKNLVATLVIHVGAQKCGSTTIQHALANIVSVVDQDVLKFRIFPAELAERMHQECGSVSNQDIDLQFDGLLKENSCLILSNELLGNYPVVVAKLAERARELFPTGRILIIGYTRAQYSYYVSAYKQWYFRDRPVLRSDIDFFRRKNLLPEKFLPFERRMFVNSIMSFRKRRQPDWDMYYKSLEAAFEGGDHIEIHSSHIPSAELNYSLLEDFFRKLSLSVGELSVLPSPPDRSNSSFNPVFCESVALGLCDQSIDSSLWPGPHENNHLIEQASNLFALRHDHDSLEQFVDASRLFQSINAAIAMNFSNSNAMYCQRFGIDERYFGDEQDKDVSISKEQLFEIARQVQNSRETKKIDDYKQQLLGELKRIEYVFE